MEISVKTNDQRYRQGQTCGKIEYDAKILVQRNTKIINIIEDVIVRREYNNICNEASTKTHGWVIRTVSIVM